MGALVPFPTSRLQNEPAGVRMPSGGSAKVIILPVVQYVRPGEAASAAAASAVHDWRKPVGST